MRILLTILTYLLSLLLVAVVAFGAVIVLAGPHSDLLPGFLQAVVFGLGWLAVLLLPVLAALRVWRRYGR
ncbi:MAG: hypothetical protein ACOY33_13380 [Pseudomonadota bacterium]